MYKPDPRIIDFLRRQHVLTLSVMDEDRPWAFNAFYVLDEATMSLVFLTNENTRHGAIFARETRVAGTVASQPFDFAQIKGVQFRGEVSKLDAVEKDRARTTYVRRIPAAEPMIGDTPLWAIRLDDLKYTDNALGFGAKMYWSREEAGVGIAE